jgi:hypothetical protein
VTTLGELDQAMKSARASKSGAYIEIVGGRMDMPPDMTTNSGVKKGRLTVRRDSIATTLRYPSWVRGRKRSRPLANHPLKWQELRGFFSQKALRLRRQQLALGRYSEDLGQVHRRKWADHPCKISTMLSRSSETKFGTEGRLLPS